MSFSISVEYTKLGLFPGVSAKIIDYLMVLVEMLALKA